MRHPQSVQSVPSRHLSVSDPGPPSSHTPSTLLQQKSKQNPGGVGGSGGCGGVYGGRGGNEGTGGQGLGGGGEGLGGGGEG